MCRLPRSGRRQLRRGLVLTKETIATSMTMERGEGRRATMKLFARARGGTLLIAQVRRGDGVHLAHQARALIFFLVLFCCVALLPVKGIVLTFSNLLHSHFHFHVAIVVSVSSSSSSSSSSFRIQGTSGVPVCSAGDIGSLHLFHARRCCRRFKRRRLARNK